MGGMKLRSRWTMGGAAYVVLAVALGTAAAVDGRGYGFYVAAIATFPSSLILSPFFYPVMVMTAMAASMSGSAPSWVIVTLDASWFGAAAGLNVLLVRLVAGNARPCWMRLRRLVTRA
jgi:hypothetical protein